MKNYIWMSDVIFSSLFNELDGDVNYILSILGSKLKEHAKAEK
ncbi:MULTISPECIES: hypothetical protein [Sphingobacterium]|nr:MULTISPECIES: hypothetical protein [Sphingobacterium]